MSILEFLCEPIVCGIVMALVSWLILDFWQNIVSVRHQKIPAGAVKAGIALLNGAMSYMAEVFTQNNASPRTISLYIPVMIILECHIIGHMKTKWGTFATLSMTSFQFISLFSVALGITNLISPLDFVSTRMGLVLPVTLMNLGLSIVFISLKIYRRTLKNGGRAREVGEILSDHKKSLILILFTTINAWAITVLTYDAIDMLHHAGDSNIFRLEICHNMIIRDLILFFTSIFMLDLQSRHSKSENLAKEAIAKTVIMEREKQTQNMVQMALEAARTDLEKKNQTLATGIEYERRLRKSLRRNILFRFSCNVTKGIVDDAGAIHIDNLIEEKEAVMFEDITKVFLEILVHPDFRAELQEKMSIKNLSSIANTEKGFDIPIKISPGGFINYITLDDDSAKIYAYVDRDYIWTDLDCTVVTGDDGDLYAYFYIMDIDEQKQREEAIKKAAITDALTGLENRRAFEEHLEMYLSSDDNIGGSLFMFDLDYFKSVNDNLGHPKGDELLKDVAGILTDTFRSDDIICRIGGDEFCAFAKGLTDIGLIKERAENLNKIGRKSYELPKGGQINVSFSIGVATIAKGDTDVEELYSNADSALYHAKESGRDCYKIFSE